MLLTSCKSFTNERLEEEVAKLREVFVGNGYPPKFFDQIKQKFLDKTSNEATKIQDNSKTKDNTDKKQNRLYLKVPFVGKISTIFARRIKSLLQPKDHDIRVVYETTKVRNSFQLKDPIPKPLLTRVVYQFICRGDPDIKYIGHTTRTLKERVNEHLRGGTAVSDHIGQCQACQNLGVTINDFHVIKTCWYKWDTSVMEALFIKTKHPVLNRHLIKPGGKQFTLKLFD